MTTYYWVDCRSCSHELLLTTYYLLLTIYYVLLMTYYLLLAAGARTDVFDLEDGRFRIEWSAEAVALYQLVFLLGDEVLSNPAMPCPCRLHPFQYFHRKSYRIPNRTESFIKQTT